MTTRIDDGGPAFPIEIANGGGHPGMSLRDYLKAQAIPAAVALWQNASNRQRMIWSGCVDSAIICQRDYPAFISNVTGWIADEMLAARKQEPTP